MESERSNILGSKRREEVRLMVEIHEKEWHSLDVSENSGFSPQIIPF